MIDQDSGDHDQQDDQGIAGKGDPEVAHQLGAIHPQVGDQDQGSQVVPLVALDMDQRKGAFQSIGGQTGITEAQFLGALLLQTDGSDVG